VKTAKLVCFNLDEPKPLLVACGRSPRHVQLRRVFESRVDECLYVRLHNITGPFCAILPVPVQDGSGDWRVKRMRQILLTDPDRPSANEVRTEALNCMEMKRSSTDFFGHKTKPSATPPHNFTSYAAISYYSTNFGTLRAPGKKDLAMDAVSEQ